MRRGPLSDEERQRIIDALPSGDTCNAIAKRLGFSPDTVSRVARTVGHDWGVKHVARAHQMNRVYGAENRAEQRSVAQWKAQQVLARIASPFTQSEFGSDNRWHTLDLDEPPPREERHMAQTWATLMREVRALDEHDRSDEHLSDFDEWLRMMSGGDEVTGA